MAAALAFEVGAREEQRAPVIPRLSQAQAGVWHGLGWWCGQGPGGSAHHGVLAVKLTKRAATLVDAASVLRLGRHRELWPRPRQGLRLEPPHVVILDAQVCCRATSAARRVTIAPFAAVGHERALVRRTEQGRVGRQTEAAVDRDLKRRPRDMAHRIVVTAGALPHDVLPDGLGLAVGRRRRREVLDPAEEQTLVAAAEQREVPLGAVGLREVETTRVVGAGSGSGAHEGAAVGSVVRAAVGAESSHQRSQQRERLHAGWLRREVRLRYVLHLRELPLADLPTRGRPGPVGGHHLGHRVAATGRRNQLHVKLRKFVVKLYAGDRALICTAKSRRRLPGDSLLVMPACRLCLRVVPGLRAVLLLRSSTARIQGSPSSHARRHTRHPWVSAPPSSTGGPTRSQEIAVAFLASTRPHATASRTWPPSRLFFPLPRRRKLPVRRFQLAFLSLICHSRVRA